MDPRDRLRLRLVGTVCGVCGRPYDAAGIRILAQREDIAFVRLHCDSCGSDGLGLVTEGQPGEEPRPAAMHPGPWPLSPEFTESDAGRLCSGSPIDEDDVTAMHMFLAEYQGDLRTLLGSAE